VCFDRDSSPPPLPPERRLLPIAGGAGAEPLTLTAADGAELSAALALAPAGSGTGVVVLPDVRGLYRFYVELTERFAEAGHSAIAIDYFGRSAGTGERDAGFDAFTHLTLVTPEMVQRDLAAAATALREASGAERLVVVGFCFGGAQACLAATDPAPGVAGVVSFYGILDARRGRLVFLPSPLDHAHGTRLPLLGIYGGADPLIPAEDVREFDRRLDAAGVPHELVAYPGAPHSFFDRKQEEHAEACADAWSRVLGFIATAPPSA
jgi:carboxymethylenebutenolidase